MNWINRLLVSSILLLQSASAAELTLMQNKVHLMLPPNVSHGKINQSEGKEQTIIEINIETEVISGVFVVENAKHPDIASYKKDLQKNWSHTLLQPPETFSDIDDTTSLLLWRPGAKEGAVAVLYFGIQDGLEFQLFFLCTHSTHSFQKETSDTINQIASSLVISSKTYKTPILKFQDDLVVLNPDISFHKPEASSAEKKVDGLLPQNAAVLKQSATPIIKEQQEYSPWLLIVAGVALAILAGVGAFWLLKKP